MEFRRVLFRSIIASKIAGISSGKVIRLKVCQGVAPSILAASYTCAGMDSLPAYSSKNVNGRLCHTLMIEIRISPSTGETLQLNRPNPIASSVRLLRDRKSVVEGTSLAVRVALGCCSIYKKNKKK